MVHSSTLSIPRALRDRASISPISTPLLNSAGMDFIPSIHSLPTPPLDVVVVIVLPVTDPAERANRSSLDGPTTSRPASRTVPTSAGPSPNRECSFVVVAAAPLLFVSRRLLLVLMMMGHVNREGRRMNVVDVGPQQHDVDADRSGAIIAMGRDGNADAKFLPLPTTKKRTRMRTPRRSGVRRRVD